MLHLHRTEKSFQFVQCIANELQHIIIKSIKEDIFGNDFEIELFNNKLISKTQIHRGAVMTTATCVYDKKTCHVSRNL